jgi:hypothetical protein
MRQFLPLAGGPFATRSSLISTPHLNIAASTRVENGGSPFQFDCAVAANGDRKSTGNNFGCTLRC